MNIINDMRKKMVGFKEDVKIEDMLEEFRKYIGKSDRYETIDVLESLNRFSFSDIYSNNNIPEYDRAVVDGFAVNFNDVLGASINNPVRLKVSNTIYPNDKNEYILENGHAYRIFTGAKIPKNADCVIMVEDCIDYGDEVDVQKSCFNYQNISRKGEDLSVGQKIISAGTKITPYHIASLISANFEKIDVFKRIRVGIINTGDELFDKDFKNTTGMMLYSLSKHYDMEPKLYMSRDNEEELKRKLIESLSENDIVFTTGGSSVGEKDIVPEVINSMNPEIFMHGVSMRPARSTGFSIINKKPVILLSGFPVASFISFSLFINEFMKKFYGSLPMRSPIIKGKITRRFTNNPGIRSFVRVKVYKDGNQIFVEPLRLTGSGILSTLTEANGILVLEEHVEGYDEGDEVTVFLTQPVGDENSFIFPYIQFM
ncbi:MAG: molybdopterin molybdotransferase MoeA [Thermoplasmata archaeon]